MERAQIKTELLSVHWTLINWTNKLVLVRLCNDLDLESLGQRKVAELLQVYNIVFESVQVLCLDPGQFSLM